MSSWRHRALLPRQTWAHRGLVRAGQMLPLPSPEPTRCDLVGSDKHGWVYIGVPLTGSRSIISTLRPRSHPDLWRRPGCPENEVGEGGLLVGKFVFSFVGNPWRRVVSCYNKKILNCNTPAKIAMLSRFPGLSAAMPFDEFVRWLCSDRGTDEGADPHWCSQWRFIYDANGHRFVDEVGRSECLKDDFDRIALTRSIDAPAVANLRRSSDMPVPPKFLDYRLYFDDKLASMVAIRYQRDIEIFGYNFEE